VGILLILIRKHKVKTVGYQYKTADFS